jgi:hypothetical protein
MITIEDRVQIEDLHSRFIHAADRRDYQLLRSLYCDEAIDDHGLYHGPVEGYIDWLRVVQDDFEMTTHVITNILCAVEGDTAESEARGTAYLRMRTDPPHNLIVINRHFDRYRRIGTQWYFQHRSLCIDWVQSFSPGDESLDIVRANPIGTMGPTDIVYERVPNLVRALRETATRTLK